jgi:hypothetical protein
MRDDLTYLVRTEVLAKTPQGLRIDPVEMLGIVSTEQDRRRFAGIAHRD